MAVARKTAAKKTAAPKNAAESASKLTLKLVQDRVTKGTVRFDAEDEDAAVRSIYVQKGFVDEGTQSITLTIEKN